VCACLDHPQFPRIRRERKAMPMAQCPRVSSITPLRAFDASATRRWLMTPDRRRTHEQGPYRIVGDRYDMKEPEGENAMRLPRRTILQLAAGAALLPAASRFAPAQAYPNKPVRFVVGFAAGGANDILARLFGEWLAERLGQPFIVENRPGASGNIAAEAVAKSAPDGYTLLFVNAPNAINATLYDKLNFNFATDIVPVGGIMRVPNIMEVTPSLPVRTVPEFIAYARANPEKLNMASAGIGTSIHVSGELFKMMTGLRMAHVPYRGSAPMLTDLMGGQVQVTFDNLPASIEFIRAGKLRPLAVTTATRSEALPDVPTIGQFVPGYEASAWFGIGAPRNTPPDVIATLNREVNAGLADPKIKAKLADLGGTIIPGSPADFGRLIASEIQKWAKVIKFANIKPE
jgi:tripartite-type tricarboxylate transporter receptor subunit TctC